MRTMVWECHCWPSGDARWDMIALWWPFSLVFVARRRSLTLKERSSKERGEHVLIVKQKHWMVDENAKNPELLLCLREHLCAFKRCFTGFRATSMKSWGTRCLSDTEKSNMFFFATWSSISVAPRLPRWPVMKVLLSWILRQITWESQSYHQAMQCPPTVRSRLPKRPPKITHKSCDLKQHTTTQNHRRLMFWSCWGRLLADAIVVFGHNVLI